MLVASTGCENVPINGLYDESPLPSAPSAPSVPVEEIVFCVTRPQSLWLSEKTWSRRPSNPSRP